MGVHRPSRGGMQVHSTRPPRKNGHPFSESASTAMTTLDNLRPLLREHREGLSSRHNRLEDYLPSMAPYFRAIREERFDEVPPPICVQLQVTTRCGTFCRMCEHWEEKRPELSTEEWSAILRDLGTYGVRTVIFSGGEPLERKDIATLLRTA